MNCYPINTYLVEQIIEKQAIKKWLLAESLGIHETTLRRWLSGRIKKISEPHLRSLAILLKTHVTEISPMLN